MNVADRCALEHSSVPAGRQYMPPTPDERPLADYMAEVCEHTDLRRHDEGLGGVITTIAIREEEQVKALLSAPDPLALAAVIALGYPVRRPRRLRRQPVASFASVDSIDGPVFGPP